MLTHTRSHKSCQWHTALLIVSSIDNYCSTLLCLDTVWWSLNHTLPCYGRIMGQPELISAVPATHTHSLSTIAHRGHKDATTAVQPRSPNTSCVCVWDLKQGFQASGKVKEARVIAVTYLGGKNVCSCSLCTLLWCTWAWNCSPFHGSEP